jgi:hypothetical protein
MSDITQINMVSDFTLMNGTIVYPGITVMILLNLNAPGEQAKPDLTTEGGVLNMSGSKTILHADICPVIRPASLFPETGDFLSG